MPSSMSTSSSLPDSTPKPTHRSTRSEHSTPLPFFPKPANMSTSTSSSSRIPPIDRPRSTTHSRSQSLADGIDVPARSTSLRRKPVPMFLPMPDTSPSSPLPPSHPFAQPTSGPSTPLSPGVRADEDLFFIPPRTHRTGPVPPRRSPRHDSPVRMASPDLSQREDAFRAREEALKAREEELRRREEYFKREEELRLREEELRAREEALYTRERETSSSLGHGSRTGSYNRQQWLDTNASALHRPLPAIPDPSRPDLIGSSESLPGPVTPTSATGGSTRPKTRHTLAQKLHLSKQPASPRIMITHPNHSLSTTNISTASTAEFSVDGIPSQEAIYEAGTLFLRDENGDLVCFGDLFPHPHSPAPIAPPGDVPPGLEEEDLPPITKTVVFFIRHFWCGQCQDYTFASLSLLDPIAIRRAGVRVVVISNGSWKIIKAYKRVLKCPFPIYVDGPRKLYRVLG